MITNKDLNLIEERLKETFVTKEDLILLEERLSAEFITKDDLQQFKSELFDKIDPVLKEITTSRDDREIVASRLSDHEDRITNLESSKH